MGVTVIDPGQGSLADAITNLGAALGHRAGKKRRREEALMADPAQLQILGTLGRRAKQAGPEAFRGLAESYGVSEDFVKNALIGQLPGLEESVAEGLQERGQAQVMVDTAIAEGALQFQTVQELLSADGGRLAAAAQMAGYNLDVSNSGAGIAQNNVRLQYFTLFDAAGGPQVQVNADLGSLGVQVEEAGLKQSHLEAYRTWVNGIDQSTPEGRQTAMMAATFVGNPGFADYLAQSEEMDFRLKLAQMQMAPTAKDKFDLTVGITSQIATAFDNLNELAGSANEDVVDAAREIYNNWNNLYAQLQAQGLVHASQFGIQGARAPTGLMGGRKGDEVEFFSRNPVSTKLSTLITSINETSGATFGDWTDDELIGLGMDETDVSMYHQYIEEVFGGVQDLDDPSRFTTFVVPDSAMIDRRHNQIIRAINDPTLSHEERTTRIDMLQNQIDDIQEQQSIYEMIGSFSAAQNKAQEGLVRTQGGQAP